MRFLPQEQPPVEGRPRLREWLSRTVVLINAALHSVLDTFRSINFDTLLQAHSTIDQFPAVQDVPELITFPEVAVNLSNDIELLPDAGTFKINKAGQYDFYVFVTAGRFGQAQEAYLLLHWEHNGVPIGSAWGLSVDGSSEVNPLFAYATPILAAGDEVSFWITVDSSGMPDAGLRAFIPTSPDVPPVRSAQVTIKRITFDE